MSRKYEFTGEVNAEGLKRIRRLSDGFLGGWIESEKNLSHEGSSWVSENARVFEDARVFGNAWVWRSSIRRFEPSSCAIPVSSGPQVRPYGRIGQRAPWAIVSAERRDNAAAKDSTTLMVCSLAGCLKAGEP